MDTRLPGRAVGPRPNAHIFARPPRPPTAEFNIFLFQNVKDASEAEARKNNYTIDESKKIHNRRLNR